MVSIKVHIAQYVIYGPHDKSQQRHKNIFLIEVSFITSQKFVLI